MVFAFTDLPISSHFPRDKETRQFIKDNQVAIKHSMQFLFGSMLIEVSISKGCMWSVPYGIDKVIFTCISVNDFPNCYDNCTNSLNIRISNKESNRTEQNFIMNYFFNFLILRPLCLYNEAQTHLISISQMGP